MVFSQKEKTTNQEFPSLSSRGCFVLIPPSPPAPSVSLPSTILFYSGKPRDLRSYVFNFKISAISSPWIDEKMNSILSISSCFVFQHRNRAEIQLQSRKRIHSLPIANKIHAVTLTSWEKCFPPQLHPCQNPWHRGQPNKSMLLPVVSSVTAGLSPKPCAKKKKKRNNLLQSSNPLVYGSMCKLGCQSKS